MLISMAQKEKAARGLEENKKKNKTQGGKRKENEKMTQ